MPQSPSNEDQVFAAQEEQKKAPRRRELSGWLKVYFLCATTAGIVTALYQLFHLDFLGTLMGSAYYFLLLTCFLPLVFLLYPLRGQALAHRPPVYDLVFSLLALAANLYFTLHAEEMSAMGWEMDAPPLPLFLGGVLVILVLEASRRVGGPVFAGLCLFFASFGLYSAHMPSLLQGMSYPVSRLVSFFAMGPDGIIGLPIRVVGNILIGYMVFAVALQVTGGGQFFLDISSALFGYVRGGAAKVSIFSSALFGSISGSSISNVLTTGAITIPAMKRAGYPAHYAAAIEACASTGGVLMPPVMGATAFVMAEFLGMAYAEICLAAVVPSILYYTGLFIQADAFAAKAGLKGMSKKDLPSVRHTLYQGWIYIAALVFLIWALLYLRWEVWAPFITTGMLLTVAAIRPGRRMRPRDWLSFLNGVGSVLTELCALLAGIGMIIGALSITGVAHSFSTEVIKLAGGKIWLLLALGAVTSFVLGMGMTITACYVFLAMVLAPALVKSGLDALAVHLFIMYWGMASYITPPVALAAFAASGIAGSDPMRTGFKSMQLGVVKYFVPFFFVINPSLIFHGSPAMVIQSLASCFLGVIVISAAMEGWVIGLGRPPWWLRAVLMVDGVMLAVPESGTDLVGLAVLVICLGLGFFRKNRARNAPETT